MEASVAHRQEDHRPERCYQVEEDVDAYRRKREYEYIPEACLSPEDHRNKGSNEGFLQRSR
jgi:hypothetical protein